MWMILGGELRVSMVKWAIWKGNAITINLSDARDVRACMIESGEVNSR